MTITRLHIAVVSLLLVICTPGGAEAGSAKILLYHHVSTETPASTSVTPQVFDQHLALLESSGYEVVPLARIVDALVNGTEMDSQWVAITFDDAYRSIASEAAPRLEARGWPYTIFVSTDFVDGGFDLYLTWDQLRALEQKKASIANHTLAHEHMVRTMPGESQERRQSRLTNAVLEAQARLTEELEAPARLFAYPFGEFNDEVQELMRALGFISFGQQSGPVGWTTSPYTIPRFPLATGFDSVDSLAEKLRTEHLPLEQPPVPATVLAADAQPPELELSIDASKGDRVRPDSLNCFVAGQPKAEISWEDETTFRVRAQKPFRAGRSKYTCTAPHPDVRGAYYWHTQLYIKPRADGTWYEG